MTPATTSAKVRMYRLQELGDCFFVEFTAGNTSSRVLIDCGSFRNGTKSVGRLVTIAEHIKAHLDGAPLDVVIGTHQHNDHLSGFVHASKVLTQQLPVEQVWLSWLDDPNDTGARKIGEKFGNMLRSLAQAHELLEKRSDGKVARVAASRLKDILGFYPANPSRSPKAPPTIPAAAVEQLRTLGRKAPSYLRPGEVFDLPGLPADTVRVYVLGPPTSAADLYDTKPSDGESYEKELTRAAAAADRFVNALTYASKEARGQEEHFPFSESLKRRGESAGSKELLALRKEYDKRGASWRTIDEEWLNQAESLALFLDTYTNNSSLVLAFEIVASGKVLLFVADAQTGNWRSWQNMSFVRRTSGAKRGQKVSAADLLKRTVFYKVGHHGSHNATFVGALEQMKSDELIAFIPVHKDDPNIRKQNGWRMPAAPLFARLREKTQHRVLRMDDANPPDCRPNSKEARPAWKAIGVTPVITDLFVEVEIKANE